MMDMEKNTEKYKKEEKSNVLFCSLCYSVA